MKKIPDLLHPTDRGMSRSIRVLGASHAAHGLASRPHFPHQHEICERIRTHLQSKRYDRDLDASPPVPTRQLHSREGSFGTTQRMSGMDGTYVYRDIDERTDRDDMNLYFGIMWSYFEFFWVVASIPICSRTNDALCRRRGGSID